MRASERTVVEMLTKSPYAIWFRTDPEIANPALRYTGECPVFLPSWYKSVWPTLLVSQVQDISQMASLKSAFLTETYA